VEGEGFEPSKAVPADLQSAPFGQLGYPSNCGADDGTRTRNLLITSQLLYQLSYIGIKGKMAELTRVELAISCVTGRHVRPLHHSSMIYN
jgi:hypothetical protein